MNPPERARWAIVGVGNELNGDDAAGILALRALKQRLVDRSDVLLIDAGTAPENFTSLLRGFAPDKVLFIDAAQMDLPPGQSAWLEVEQIDGVSASTHTLPLTVLAGYLQADLGCRVQVVAVQVERVGFGLQVSETVVRGVERLVEELAEMFGEEKS
ncbi:MAG: hydrogenase 3 maturation endopeptidase HyCI [Anaerolineae bacterium]|nr:hydrogenase 3 maturation endopeptidase HyCI [Anaerolineae bacterium]